MTLQQNRAPTDCGFGLRPASASRRSITTNSSYCELIRYAKFSSRILQVAKFLQFLTARSLSGMAVLLLLPQRKQASRAPQKTTTNLSIALRLLNIEWERFNQGWGCTGVTFWSLHRNRNYRQRHLLPLRRRTLFRSPLGFALHSNCCCSSSRDGVADEENAALQCCFHIIRDAYLRPPCHAPLHSMHRISFLSSPNFELFLREEYAACEAIPAGAPWRWRSLQRCGGHVCGAADGIVLGIEACVKFASGQSRGAPFLHSTVGSVSRNYAGIRELRRCETATTLAR